MTDTPTTPDTATSDRKGPDVQTLHHNYLAKRTHLVWAHGHHGELTEQAERTEDHSDADRFHDETLAPAIQGAGDAADRLIDALYELMPAIETVIEDAYTYRLGEAYDEDDEDLDEADIERLREIRALADQLGVKV